jgi:hypothetical protein
MRKLLAICACVAALPLAPAAAAHDRPSVVLVHGALINTDAH